MTGVFDIYPDILVQINKTLIPVAITGKKCIIQSSISDSGKNNNFVEKSPNTQLIMHSLGKQNYVRKNAS